MHGISCYLTQPLNPQHNGVVERRNRSLQDNTRCLLFSKHLPNYIWGEAIRVATFILNLRSTKAYLITTPNELITKKKPNISTFQIFGCTVYVQFPGSKRSKLDSRTQNCILLRYDEHVKGHHCCNLPKKRVLISGNVCILETTTSTEPIAPAES